MMAIAELMDLARRCRAQARVAPDAIVRTGLIRIGDGSLRHADDLKRRRGVVVQAVFPRPGPIIVSRPTGLAVGTSPS